MPAPSPALRYGRIVYAWIEDRNGHAKLRPALILTPTQEITTTGSLVLAAITTTFPDPPPAFCIELPWHPAGRVGTALRRRSAAVLNWLATINPDDVVGFGGDVPIRLMISIQGRLAELSGE